MQTPFITVLVFMVLYQLSNRTYLRPLISASIIALTPLVYNLIVRLILGANALNVVQWHDVLTFILQFAVALLVFYKLESDDSYIALILWGAGGIITLTILIPGFVLFLTLP